jgi:hypothetical protein
MALSFPTLALSPSCGAACLPRHVVIVVIAGAMFEHAACSSTPAPPVGITNCSEEFSLLSTLNNIQHSQLTRSSLKAFMVVTEAFPAAA